MRVAGEFSLIFESEVIKSRLVRDANAASISDYVLPSPPLPHSSFPFPPRTFFFAVVYARIPLLSLFISDLVHRFLSDADTPQRSVSCFPKGFTRNNKNSKKSSGKVMRQIVLSLSETSEVLAWTRIGPCNFFCPSWQIRNEI